MSALSDFKLTDVSNNCLQILGAACPGHGLFHGLEHVTHVHACASQEKLPSVSLSYSCANILIDHAMSGCVDGLLSLHAIGTWS